MKKNIMCLLLAAMLISLTSCVAKEEEEEMDLGERFTKSHYVVELLFQLNVTDWQATHLDYADSFTSVAIVYSKEDASGFPEDVIVAWPYEKTHRIIEILNEEVIRHSIDLEQYSLQYPITIENLIEDWEKVDDFWMNEMSESMRRIIRNDAIGFYDRYREEQEARRESTEATGD